MNNIHTYKVSLKEAFLFFFLVLIGQIVGGVITVLATFFLPSLLGVAIPLSFGAGFIFSAFLIMQYKRLGMDSLKSFFTSKKNIAYFGLGILLYFCSLPIAEFFATIVPTKGIPALEEFYKKSIEETFQIIFNYPVFAFITICILAPVLEEFVFRGLLLKGLLNHGMNPWWAISLCALLFGAAHLNPWQMLGAGILGFVFGYIYWRTQDLWICIFLHSLNNSISFFVQLQSGTMEEMVFEPNYFLLGGSLIMVGLVGYYFYQLTQKPKQLI